jgi:hypothetical protein
MSFFEIGSQRREGGREEGGRRREEGWRGACGVISRSLSKCSEWARPSAASEPEGAMDT